MELYRINIFWSHEDSAWMAHVPLLNITSDGQTRAEALEAAERNIAEWLISAKQEGWAIPVEV